MNSNINPETVPEIVAAEEKITRRSFLKSTALSGAAISGAVSLSAGAPSAEAKTDLDNRSKSTGDPFASVLQKCGSELGDLRKPD